MHSLIEVWAPGVSGSHPESLTCTRVPCPAAGPSAPWALTSPLQPASLSLEGMEKTKWVRRLARARHGGYTAGAHVRSWNRRIR